MAIPVRFIVTVGVPAFAGFLIVIVGVPSGISSVLGDAVPVDAARKSVAVPAGSLIVITWALADTISALDDAILLDFARGSCRQEIGSPLAPSVSPPPLKIEILVEPLPSSLPFDPRHALFS